MQCNVLSEDDKVEVLYGSADARASRRVREHLAACPACRDELRALEGTRRKLQLWTLPASGRPAARRPGLRALPVAAALLVALGGAFALRGTEIRYEAGRISMRIGPSDDQALRQLLAEQQARHEREIADIRASLTQPIPAPAALRRSDVQGWIRESEDRQSRAFLARLAEFKERSDSERRLDMARVSAGLSYLDGKNGQHVARTSELMNYMLQASYKGSVR
jgi:hypothetical protein